MGWSLTRLPTPDPALVEAALVTAGKALYLANAFESKCRFVLRVAQLESQLSSNPDLSLVDAITTLAKDKLLGPTIAALKSFPPVSADNVVALEKARDARNFIAHEGAYFGPLHAKQMSILEHLEKLRGAVTDLAEGDDVVSRWVYAIEEKEVPTQALMSNYVELVDQWVFGEGRI